MANSLFEYNDKKNCQHLVTLMVGGEGRLKK